MKTLSAILIITSPAFAGSSIGFVIFLIVLVSGYFLYRHSERSREKWEQERKREQEFDESKLY